MRQANHSAQTGLVDGKLKSSRVLSENSEHVGITLPLTDALLGCVRQEVLYLGRQVLEKCWERFP